MFLKEVARNGPLTSSTTVGLWLEFLDMDEPDFVISALQKRLSSK